MKNRLLVLSIVLMMVFSLFCLASCGNSKKENKGISGDINSTVVLESIEKYKIIIPEDSDELMNKTYEKLYEAIKSKTGKELDCQSDWIGPGFEESEYEILVGMTNRTNTPEKLHVSGFYIGMNGNKLLIAGGSSTSTDKAVKLFIEKLIGDDGKIYVPKSHYSENKEPLLEKLTINGKDISEFTIYPGKCDPLFTVELKYQLSALSDGEIKVQTNENKLDKIENLIRLDVTGLSYDDYSINVTDNVLTIKSSYHSTIQAIEKLVDTIAEKKSGNAFDITSEINTDGSTNDLPKVKRRDEVLGVLEYCYNDDDHLIAGNQVHCLNEMPSEMLKKFYDKTKTYPAFMGHNLGTQGLDVMYVEKEKWSQAICEIVDYVGQGGIIEYALIWENPKGTKGLKDPCRGSIGDDNAFKELMTEGTALYNNFMPQVKAYGEYIKALYDVGIPVMVRPFAENNAGWFWWGIVQTINDSKFVLKQQTIIDLWKFVYDYYTKDLGMKDLIWVHAPNIATSNEFEYNPATTYPGDDMCDIAGLDWYTEKKYEIAISPQSYKVVMDLGKISALCEYGTSYTLISHEPNEQARLFTCEDIMKDFKRMRNDGYKIAYFKTFSNTNSIFHYPGCEEFMKSEYIISLDEMQEYYRLAAK